MGVQSWSASGFFAWNNTPPIPVTLANACLLTAVTGSVGRDQAPIMLT
jgi:hypothetical protein